MCTKMSILRKSHTATFLLCGIEKCRYFGQHDFIRTILATKTNTKRRSVRWNIPIRQNCAGKSEVSSSGLTKNQWPLCGRTFEPLRVRVRAVVAVANEIVATPASLKTNALKREHSFFPQPRVGKNYNEKVRSRILSKDANGRLNAYF